MNADPVALNPGAPRMPTTLGVPREVKSGEARVGLTPAEVRQLVGLGHTVRVETGAGRLVGMEDAAYVDAGAQIVATAAEVYAAGLIVKVKEIQPSEFALLHRGQVICGFAQVARDASLLDGLLAAGVSVVAYEAIHDADGRLPVLAPMSRIAGRMSAGVAQWCLQTAQGGRGVLLGEDTRAVVIGAGVAGRAAAESLHRTGCTVSMVVRDEARAQRLRKRLPTGVRVLALAALSEHLSDCDVLIGAVSVPGALSPKLVSRAMMRSMPRGAVFIDIGIDMGGIAETSRQSTWAAPIYVEEGIVHFCVPNMPAQVPQAATAALAGAALPYVQAIATRGLLAAARLDEGLANAVQVHGGAVTAASIARDTGREYVQLFT